MNPAIVTPDDLVGLVHPDGPVGPGGDVESPLVLVDLDNLPDGSGRSAEIAAHLEASPAPPRVLVGCAHAPVAPGWSPLLERLTCTVAPEAPDRTVVALADTGVPDIDIAVEAIIAATALAPRAAATLDGLLRLTADLPPRDGVVVESLAYSMLLSGPEFARWRASVPVRPVPPMTADAVLVDRVGEELQIVLNRPERHNAYGAAVRDGLLAALDVADADPTIGRIVLSGAGRSFCSGGDLDEFGTTPDVATAHLIRLQRSAAARLSAARATVEARVHGACIGAGIELPSFADRVVADSGAYFRLPELAMGLVPGAGGTAGITARIGRWRTAYLALTGASITTATALRWGLVDAVAG